MEKFTAKQFQNDFDNLFSRIKNGETIIIEDGGKNFSLSAYICLLNDDIERLDAFIKNHKNHNDAC